MDNPRAEKVAVVTEVREHFERSNAAILTEYRGLTVKDLAGLRRTLREIGSDYKIYKNTLVRFAANDLGLGELENLLVGPTAIAFVDGDAAAVAKALRDYARTNPKLTVKGGVLGTKVMSLADATALADLPPREVVLARLAGAFAAPMQSFAGLLQALPRSFAYGLKALIEKRGGPDSAPAESAEGADSPATAAEAPSAAPEPGAASAQPAAEAPSAAPEPETAEVAAATVEDSVVDALGGAAEPAAGRDGSEMADVAPSAVEAAAEDALTADTVAETPTAEPPTAEPLEPSAAAAEPDAEAPSAAPEPETAEVSATAVEESVVDALAGAAEPAADSDDSQMAEVAPSGVEAAAEDALTADTQPEPAAVSEPAESAVSDPTEALEPPELEDAAEAALTPALSDEPAEVEPLAAHGIPADVEPKILSVEPEPDAPADSDESHQTPPAEATAPDRDHPPAS
jgi:large subunit ribosomal protein L10